MLATKETYSRLADSCDRTGNALLKLSRQIDRKKFATTDELCVAFECVEGFADVMDEVLQFVTD